MLTQGEKDIVGWLVLLLVVIFMTMNVANANDDHDHDDKELIWWPWWFVSGYILSSQVIGEILDTLGLTECKTTRCDQHINQRSRKLLNYDETLSPKEANIW